MVVRVCVDVVVKALHVLSRFDESVSAVIYGQKGPLLACKYLFVGTFKSYELCLQ
jgi:hypothetical protein